MVIRFFDPTFLPLIGMQHSDNDITSRSNALIFALYTLNAVAIAILHKSWDTKLNISGLSESMPLTTLCFNCLKIKIAKFGVYNFA